MTITTDAHTPTFTIRLALPGDAALLAQLGAETFAAAFSADNRPEDMTRYLENAFSPRKQAQELAEPGSLFLIVEDQGQPAGYARLKQGGAPACIGGEHPIEIARFYALPAWHGRGLGAALMQACLAHAERQGGDVLWLSTWQRNPRGLAFYRKWGFEIVGTTTFVLGADLQEDYLLQRLVVPLPGFSGAVDPLERLKQRLQARHGDLLDRFTLPPPVHAELGGQILDFDETAGTLNARFPVQERFLNPYLALQGGIIAAAVDNSLGPLSLLVAPPNVTRRLELTYSAPATLEMGFIEVRARLVKREGRLLTFTADVLDPQGKRLARARAEHWLVDA